MADYPAPLIKTPNTDGGTFWVFSSAAEDLSKTFNNPNLTWRWSKFALLNIPDVKTPTQNQNSIQFRTIDGAILDGVTDKVNIDWAQSLQNYAMNFESLLIDEQNTPEANTPKKTVAERIFWKWLKELGAIRFSNAGDVSAVSDRFIEEEESSTGSQIYNRVLKYLGDIDAQNNVTKNAQSWTELYLNVPTTVGDTPNPLFLTLSDDIYSPDLVLSGNDEFISERDSTTDHPFGLSLSAYYDYDENITYSNSTNADWHGSSTVNSYYTQPTQFDDPSNTSIIKDAADYSGFNFSDVEYLRTNLDGITIDWDTASYSSISDDPVATLSNLNNLPESDDFSFNAALVFYDVYNPENPSEYVRNLYGLIIFNPFETQGGTSYIQRLEKVRANNLLGKNGTSYGLKLNFKFDATGSQTGVVTDIQPGSRIAFDAFLKSSSELLNAINLLQQNSELINDIQDQLNSLENDAITSADLNDVKDRINTLEQEIDNAKLNLSDPDTIMQLIQNTNERINNLLSGNTTLDLAVDFEQLNVKKPGLNINKNGNRVTVENTQQEYTLGRITHDSNNSNVITSTNPVNLNNITINTWVQLRNYTNYVKIYTVNVNNSVSNNFTIKINDSSVSWKNGQVVRFYFPNQLNLDNTTIKLITDAANKSGNGVYSQIIDNLNTNDKMSNNLIFDVVCTDATNFNFDVIVWK